MKLAVFILLECHAQTTRIAGTRRQSIVRKRWSELHGFLFAWSLALRILIGCSRLAFHFAVLCFQSAQTKTVIRKEKGK